jgi:hypothetical protein
MVKENTHLSLAYLVLHRLKNEAVSAPIAAHTKEYLLGSILPDSFHYAGLQNVSARLHGRNGEHTSALVFRMLSYIKQHKTTEQDRAFVYGYLTHCAADIVFHPAVWYFAGHPDSADARYRHFRFETWLDQHLHRRPYQVMPRSRTVRGLSFPQILSDYLAIDRPYPTTERAVRRQLAASVLFRTQSIYTLVRAAGFIPQMREFRGLFYADVRRSTYTENLSYRHPVTGEEHSLRVHDLLSQSVMLSRKLIVCAHAYIENSITKRAAEHILSGQSLETGLVGVGIQRMRYFAQQ